MRQHQLHQLVKPGVVVALKADYAFRRLHGVRVAKVTAVCTFREHLASRNGPAQAYADAGYDLDAVYPVVEAVAGEGDVTIPGRFALAWNAIEQVLPELPSN